jgi:hypothetical protein
MISSDELCEFLVANCRWADQILGINGGKYKILLLVSVTT